MGANSSWTSRIVARNLKVGDVFVDNGPVRYDITGIDVRPSGYIKLELAHAKTGKPPGGTVVFPPTDRVRIVRRELLEKS